MLRSVLQIFCFFLLTQGFAQRVPFNINFADQTLRLSDHAHDEVSENVDLLTRHPAYFNKLRDRVLIYFPIIERILEEEGVPEDIKYLVIQESSLIPDAVSKSNAVGYWQFKKLTALEYGLQIDHHVDERKHIVASTRAAARYLKNSNRVLDNWIYSLLSYNTGLTGVMKEISKNEYGKKRIDIDKNTHWYIKKFLAHKIAFENALNHAPELYLKEIENINFKDLREVAKAENIEEEFLAEYNMWALKSKIPSDKKYVILVPTFSEPPERLVVRQEKFIYKDESKRFPIIKPLNESRLVPVLARINGIPGIVAGPEDDLYTLAEKGDIRLGKLLRINDLESYKPIEDGDFYYLKRKKNKAKTYYHIVKEGETLWSISQLYGIKLKKLLKKNRMRKLKDLKEGRVLWLRFTRPSDVPVAFEQTMSNKDVEKIKPESIEKELEPKLNEEAPEIKSVKEDESEITLNEIDLRRDTIIDHRVKAGETLFAISRQYNISVEEIVAQNNLDLTQKIHPGQLLSFKVRGEPTIHEPTTVEPVREREFITHIVRKGETLYQLTKKYGVTLDEILEWNKKENHDLEEGEQLKIMK